MNEYIDWFFTKALPLPLKFDENEWAAIITFVIGYTAVFLCPKRFSKVIVLLLLSFGVAASMVLDQILAAGPIDLYDVYDSKKFELFDLLIYFMIAPFSYLFIYFYDLIKVKKSWILLYLFLCSLLAVAVEWLFLHLHMFTFKNWKLVYSYPIYLSLQILLLLFYHFIKKTAEEDRLKSE
ncbi:MAG TPA: hypothetical protein VGE40_13220 [Bacilli bacterium]